MSAVDHLLRGLTAVDEIVDYIITPPPSTPQSILDGLARAACIQGLICFETFMKERSVEWTTYLSSARISPTRLPGGSRKFEDRIVQTLPRTLQFADVGDRAQIIEDVGSALVSLSTGTLVAHELAFAWPGSNVQAGDVSAALRMVGLDGDKGWSEMTSLWSRIDPRFPGNANAKSLFESFCHLRHDAAHKLGTLPMANLASVTRNVRLVSVCLDALMSDGLRQIRHGATPPLVRGSTISVRTIKRDGAKWPEYPPNVARAYRRHPSREVAIDEASRRALSSVELVIALDGSEILDWRYPAL